MYQSKWTTLPSEEGHTVLLRHRDTVFTRLGEIKIGDYLIVKFENRLFPYKVKNIWITSKNDRSVIVSKDEPTLTLTTCYPFHYIGSAPKRYIVQGTIEEWVTTGSAPTNLVTTDKGNERTRSMCEYPTWPIYNGSGDVDVAESYSCSR